MAIAPTLHHFFLLFILLLQTDNSLVGADDKFIEQRCRDTEVPTLCIQCIKSDPDGEKAVKATDIATIAIKCLSNHAEALVKNMSSLASTYSSDKKLVTACENCNKGYSQAKKTLSKADAKLKDGDYDNANHFVILALADELVRSCGPSLEPYGEKKGVYDAFYQITVYEGLTGIALAIIDRL